MTADGSFDGHIEAKDDIFYIEPTHRYFNSDSNQDQTWKVFNTFASHTNIIILLACLYFFIYSLSFLSDSFCTLGGKNIGALFLNSEMLKNPVVGVMIGVLVTVLIQSSSISTPIIGDREQFRKPFARANVHDWLSAFILVID